MPDLAPGLIYLPNILDRDQQIHLVEELREIVKAAPLFTPHMPKTGKPFSVRMTNCGSLGWVSDRLGGYRYQPQHPVTGADWPAIPPSLIALWRELTNYPHPPEACLINYYAPGARMGLHQDRDEQALDAPVLSLSLGDSAVFRYGGNQRNDSTKSIRLHSGDAVVIGGDSRLIFHGIERLLPGTSMLLADGGRINLTLRRVTLPA